MACGGWHGLGLSDLLGGGRHAPPELSAPALSCGDRYKMTCEYTWPNHLLGSDRAAVSALLEQHGLQGDVAFGHTKLFIRSPQTLVTLEQSRARLIPIIVLLLQKVQPGRMPVCHGGCGGMGVHLGGGSEGCAPGGEGREGCAPGGRGGMGVPLEEWGDGCAPCGREERGVHLEGEGREGCAPPGVRGCVSTEGAHKHPSRRYRNPL